VVRRFLTFLIVLIVLTNTPVQVRAEPFPGGIPYHEGKLTRFRTRANTDTLQNNHNILQGVADPSLRLTQPQMELFDQWIQKVHPHRLRLLFCLR
jgi:hypothetical protein